MRPPGGRDPIPGILWTMTLLEAEVDAFMDMMAQDLNSGAPDRSHAGAVPCFDAAAFRAGYLQLAFWRSGAEKAAGYITSII